MSLLQETIDDMAENGVTPEDVRWVGIRDEVWWSWEDFARIADVGYDSGYGGEQVNTGLLVVGDDWWLERHQYDGMEWFEFKVLPARPPHICEPNQTAIVGHGWRWNRQDVCLE